MICSVLELVGRITVRAMRIITTLATVHASVTTHTSKIKNTGESKMTKKQQKCQHIRPEKRVIYRVSIAKEGKVEHWHCGYCGLWFRRINGKWVVG